MNDNTRESDSRNTGTGPQGTRVFRREDIQKHVTGHGGDSGAARGAVSGAALVGVNGPLKGKRIDIPPGRSTLGRDVANNIIVDDDSVSLVHARLVEKNGEWRVLNLLSTNGTWVNNRKVSDGALRNGDTVCFGEAEFVFQSARNTPPPGLWNKLRRWFGAA